MDQLQQRDTMSRLPVGLSNLSTGRMMFRLTSRTEMTILSAYRSQWSAPFVSVSKEPDSRVSVSVPRVNLGYLGNILRSVPSCTVGKLVSNK